MDGRTIHQRRKFHSPVRLFGRKSCSQPYVSKASIARLDSYAQCLKKFGVLCAANMGHKATRFVRPHTKGGLIQNETFDYKDYADRRYNPKNLDALLISELNASQMAVRALQTAILGVDVTVKIARNISDAAISFRLHGDITLVNQNEGLRLSHLEINYAETIITGLYFARSALQSLSPEEAKYFKGKSPAQFCIELEKIEAQIRLASRPWPSCEDLNNRALETIENARICVSTAFCCASEASYALQDSDVNHHMKRYQIKMPIGAL